jgi:hypothetical protein
MNPGIPPPNLETPTVKFMLFPPEELIGFV